MLNLPNGSKIIISADDFGISRRATERILELAKSGKLDRVEVMMSENITQQQASKLLRSGVKIDIHFHLAEDKINYWQNRPREYREGNLKRIFSFLYDYFFSKDKTSEVEAVWHFQFSDFRRLFGRNPDGLSSHEHIHFFPFYFKIIQKMALENSIEYIRFGENNFAGKNLVSFILNILRNFNLKHFHKSEIKTTDFFVSFDWLKNYNKFSNSISPDKTVELVFHPERDEELEFIKNKL